MIDERIRPEDGTQALPLPAWLAALDAIAVHELTAGITPTRAARFAEPVNVVFRGLFGDAFRARRCLTGAGTCAGCVEAPLCDFDRVFERDEGIGQRAFWLRGLHAERALAAGQRLRVTVALLDRERGMLPDVTAALRHALGALGSERDLPWPVSPASRGTTAAISNEHPHGDRGAVRLETRTPVLLRGDDDVAEALCPEASGFGKLLRAGVRRLASLARASDPSRRVPAVAWPDLRGLRLVEDQMRPWEAARVSRAQQRRQPLKGIAGSAVIEGDAVSAVLPLLRAMERVGVGRKTSFGFGEIRVEALR